MQGASAMDETFDVVVVGAGPAGGSAGLHCSRNGLKTLIIEEHAKVGEPVHCGECLSIYATKNTGVKLPEEVVSEHVKGVRVVFPDGTSSALNEDGYVLEKHLFEQWLSQQAVEAGAQLKLPARLEELQRKGGLWELKTTQGIVKSKILIDASGVASVVSRKLGLNERFRTVTGIQYELRDIPRDGSLDFYLWPRFAKHGYLWMIPKKDGRANVGLVTTDTNCAKKNTDLFVEKMGWKGKEKVKTFGGLIPCSGPLKRTFDEGLMIIGDAAGFTSPLFEGGSHLGLKSGEMAAQVAKAAVDGENFTREAFTPYEQKWKGEFPPYEKIVKGKDALYGFSDDELNFIGKSFPRNFDDFGRMQKTLFGLKVLLHNPSLYSRGFASAMHAFEYSQAKCYGW